MKKMICLILCLILTALCCVPAAAQDASAENAQVRPVIVIPGICESMLVLDKGAENETKYYQPVTWIFNDVKKDLIVGALKSLFLFSYKDLTETGVYVGGESIKLLEMDADGKSVYNISPAVVGAAESSYAAIRRNGRWGTVDHGAHIVPFIADRIGEENVFFFCYDWRLGAITLADQLRGFIDEVREQTGSEKVDIYCNSYGSTITAQYIDGNGGAALGRVLFCSPAWSGSEVFTKLFPENKNDFQLNPGPMARIILRLGMHEMYIESLLKLVPARIIKNVGYPMVMELMDRYLMTAPGIWCLCKTKDYEAMKARFLDPVKNAAVIEECDAVQYGVMSHIPETLARAKADGVRVAVLMGNGIELAAGSKINGDGLVDAAGAVGGEGTPLGETFGDGRTGKHISPSNDLDLTNAFLPENTWIVREMTHGQSYWDNDTLELTMKLLLTDDLDSVDSDPAFPQFTDSHCPGDDLSIRLETRADNYLRPADGKIRATLRNDSLEHEIYVTGVTACGIPYAVSPVSCKLMPGESKQITLTPLTKSLRTPAIGKINVTYIEKDFMSFAKSRSFHYTAF